MEYSAVSRAGGAKRHNVKSFKATIPRTIAGAMSLEDKDTVSWELKFDKNGPYTVMRKLEGKKR